MGVCGVAPSGCQRAASVLSWDVCPRVAGRQRAHRPLTVQSHRPSRCCSVAPSSLQVRLPLPAAHGGHAAPDARGSGHRHFGMPGHPRGGGPEGRQQRVCHGAASWRWGGLAVGEGVGSPTQQRSHPPHSCRTPASSLSTPFYPSPAVAAAARWCCTAPWWSRPSRSAAPSRARSLPSTQCPHRCGGG